MALTLHARGGPLGRIIFKSSVQYKYVPSKCLQQCNFTKDGAQARNMFPRHIHRNNSICWRNSKLGVAEGFSLLKTRVHLPGQWQSVRQFHTTSHKKAIPPVIWLVVKPVAKLASVLTGRSLRKVWQKMPESEKKEIRQQITKGRITSALAVLFAIIGIDYVTHLQETAITRRKRYLALTPEQLNKIIDFELKRHFDDLAADVLPPTDKIYQYVIKVASRIINANQDLEFFRDQKWTVIVVNDTSENAFVLPTGHIFVHKGLLQMMSSEDELAAVLGHEMSHALLQHSAEKISFLQFVDRIVILTMAALWFFMPTDGIAVITHWFYERIVDIMLHLPYSRKLETEADEVGLQLIAKACYDVRAASAFWSRMYIRSRADGGTAEMPQLLSTHPGHEKRADTLDSLIPQAVDLMKKCNCPRLPKEDPRKTPEAVKQILAAGGSVVIVDSDKDSSVNVRKSHSG